MLKSIEHQIRFLGEFVTRNVRKKKNITGNFDEKFINEQNIHHKNWEDVCRRQKFVKPITTIGKICVYNDEIRK